MNLPSRRRKPRTPIGKVIRAWPWIRRARRALKVARPVIKAAPVLLAGGAAALVVKIVRRVRGRGSDAPLTSPASMPITRTVADAPSPGAGAGPGTREAGLEASPSTQTEQNLEEEKAGGAPNESAPGGQIPPAP